MRQFDALPGELIDVGRLEDRVAVVYGGGGSVGGVVARAFAREGARVFLAGRTLASLERTAADISSSGGQAEVAQVDATLSVW